MTNPLPDTPAAWRIVPGKFDNKVVLLNLDHPLYASSVAPDVVAPVLVSPRSSRGRR